MINLDTSKVALDKLVNSDRLVDLGLDREVADQFIDLVFPQLDKIRDAVCSALRSIEEAHPKHTSTEQDIYCNIVCALFWGGLGNYVEERAALSAIVLPVLLQMAKDL